MQNSTQTPIAESAQTTYNITGKNLWDEILKAVFFTRPQQLFHLFKEVYGKEYPPSLIRQMQKARPPSLWTSPYWSAAQTIITSNARWRTTKIWLSAWLLTTSTLPCSIVPPQNPPQAKSSCVFRIPSSSIPRKIKIFPIPCVAASSSRIRANISIRFLP